MHAPGVLGYDPNMPFYPYDPDEAKRLLKEMGYLDNPRELTALSFSFSSFPEGPKYMEAIVAYWQQVGIKVKIQALDWANVFKMFNAEPMAFTAPGMVGVQSPSFRPSMLNNFRIFAVSNSRIRTEVEKALGMEAGGFLVGMSDLNKADRLYLNAVTQMDPEKLEEAIRQINKEGYEDYWGLPLGARSTPWVARPGIVKDWTPVPLSGICPRYHTARRGPDVK